MFKNKIATGVFGLITCLTVGAQGTGYYQPIPYRDNDPFVFCHYGNKNAICWWPAPPYTGGSAYTVNPMCRPPIAQCSGYYCIEDPQEEIDGLFNYYEVVCPHAMTSGEWKGPGTGQETPFEH